MNFAIALLMLINHDRTYALVLDDVLVNRAEQRAEYLCSHNQWSHDGWLDSFKDIKFKQAGENLAKNFDGATSTHEALMNSPSHKKNIVNKKYKRIGIGRGSCNITVELFKD